VETGGFWANEPFLMSLLVAGTLEHVPEVLYLRWNNRGGGLTDGWKQLPPHRVASGWRANVCARLDIISRATADPAERDALVLALYLQTFPVLRELCDERGNALFPTPASVHPLFDTAATPRLLARYGAEIEGWARARFERCQARRLHSDRE
jgi:hypothetical protein